MAILHFIPEVWSAQLQSSLKESLVFGSPKVVNRSYEGEIREKGDTVRINSIGRPTINPYVKNATNVQPQVLTDAERVLTINQANYFAFEVDDIDKRQAASGGALLDEAANEAAFGLADAADAYIYTQILADVDAANVTGATTVNTAALAETMLVAMKTDLDTANVPTQGRFAVLSPNFANLLLRSTLFAPLDASGTTQALRDGYIGRAFGFDILISTNIPMVGGTDDWIQVAGHPSATTYAEQINKVEAYRPENAFSDALKGLHLFGAKVVRPSALATYQASLT